MLHFFCPNCNKRLKADPPLAGKRIKCPNCSQVLTVPPLRSAGPTSGNQSTEEENENHPQVPENDQNEEPQPRRRRKKRRRWQRLFWKTMIGIGIAYVATLFLLLIIVPMDKKPLVIQGLVTLIMVIAGFYLLKFFWRNPRWFFGMLLFGFLVALPFLEPRLSDLTLVLGILIMVMGRLWLLFVVFFDIQNPLWFIGILLFDPFVTILLLFQHKDSVFRPFCLSLAGFVLFFSAWIRLFAIKTNFG